MNILIGLTGLKGSGKDTFAEALVDHSDFVRYAFADPLKRSAAAALGIDVETLEAHKNNPHAYVKLVDGESRAFGNPAIASITVREYLQRYGTEAHRDIFGTEFWVRPVVEAARLEERAVITDARFENEQLAVSDAGGFVIRIDREGQDVGDGHASEQVEHGLTDIVVPNNGTIQDLWMAARVVVRDIKLGKLSRAN